MTKKTRVAAPSRPITYVRDAEMMVEVAPGISINLAAAKRRGLVPEDFDGARPE